MFLFAAEVTIEHIMWTALAGAGTVIAALFRMLWATKDQLIAAKEKEHLAALDREKAAKEEVVSVNKSYREIAMEAVETARATANVQLRKKGRPVIVPLADVVPESHSPSTEKQRQTAEISTMRQDLAQIKLEIGHEPRPTPPHAVNDNDPHSVERPHRPRRSQPLPKDAVEVVEATKVVEAVEKVLAKIPEQVADLVAEQTTVIVKQVVAEAATGDAAAIKAVEELVIEVPEKTATLVTKKIKPDA